MSEPNQHRNDAADTIPNAFAEQDEVLNVLSSLRTLIARTSHPVVRTCLEQAHEDILHLTSDGDERQADRDESVAA